MLAARLRELRLVVSGFWSWSWVRPRAARACFVVLVAAVLVAGAGCGLDARAPAPPAGEAAPLHPVWFVSLRMISRQVGWALRWTENPGVPDAAELAASRTTDGGHRWTDVTPPAARPFLSPTQTYGTLFALDAKRAWFAVSRQRRRGLMRSAVFTTSDGGRTWSASRALHVPGSIKAIEFVDRRHGWLLSDLGAVMGSDAVAVLATGDGGRKWSLVARTPPVVTAGSGIGGLPVACDKTGIDFETPTVGWITGGCRAGGPYVEVTHDGGRTWTAQALPIARSACLEGCEASSQQFFGPTGFMTVPGVALLVTRDGGAIWSPVSLPPTAGGFEIQFVDAHHGFLIPVQSHGSRRGRVLYRTSDAGRTWTAVLPNRRVDKLGSTFEFTDANAGVSWTPGADATSGVPPLYQTTNGGKTWARIIPRVRPAG